MTCPIDSLEPFSTNHWDVDSLCGLMACRECTAEPGKGALWHMLYPPYGLAADPDPGPDLEPADDDIPF